MCLFKQISQCREEIRIEDVIIHEKFNEDSFNNDIALVSGVLHSCFYMMQVNNMGEFWILLYSCHICRNSVGDGLVMPSLLTHLVSK